MTKLKTLLSSLALAVFTHELLGQVPDAVDPGNARGDADTLYLWSNPYVYIPLLIAVVLVILAVIYKRNRKSTSS